MAAQNILFGMGIGLFACTGAISIGVIAATVAPQWHRIVELLSGRADPAAPARLVIGGAK